MSMIVRWAKLDRRLYDQVALNDNANNNNAVYEVVDTFKQQEEERKGGGNQKRGS